MPQERTDEELREAATHVAHEIRMLASAWKRHRGDRHAYVGWFVHCRTLMDFFDPDCECSEPEDDVCAWHFFEHGGADEEVAQRTWRRIRDTLDPPPRYDEDDDMDYRDAVNKLAAHLTYKRVEIAERPPAGEKFTPSAEITEYLLGLARLFLDNLPEGRVGWFGKLDML